MKLTKEKAIELSIKKWEWIVENDGSMAGLTLAIPELIGLASNCGLCEKYWKDHAFCKNCPINYGYDCYDIEHPFQEWGIDNTKESAQKVLDLIKSIK